MLHDLSHGRGSLVTKIVLGLVFLVMLASLALMDVRGVLRGNHMGTGTVATINGERITSTELQREMQRIGYRMNLPAAQLKDPKFMQDVLRIMIAQKLNEEGYKDLKLNFSDAQLAAEIKRLLVNPAAPNQGGDLKTRYETMLRNSGLTEKDFVQTVRTSMAQRLVDEAFDAGKLPDPLWDRLQKARKDERRDILFVNIPLKPDAVKMDKDADAWMQSFYKENQDKFMLPEQRKGRVFVITKDQLAKTGGDDPQNYLMEIEDAFAGGDDAETVAKQYKLTTRAATDKELTGDLEEDEVSSAVPLENGDYGFVLIDDIAPAQPKAFADVKGDLEKIYRQKTAYEAAQKTMMLLKASPNPVAMAADQNNVETFSRESVALSDDVAPLFDTAETNTLIDLPPLKNGDLCFGIVRSITPGKTDKYVAHKASTDEFKAAQSAENTSFADQLLAHWYDNADIKINDKLLAILAKPAQDDTAL